MAWPDLMWTMWLEIITGTSVAGWVVALGATVAAGVALGHVRVFGVSLGVTTVLFAAVAYAWAFWSPHGGAVHALAEARAAAEALRSAAAAPDAQALVAKHLAAIETAQHTRKEVLEFVREFGLVLFVYCVGMMVGPGFVQSLKDRGVRWNVMAASVVLLGLGTAALVVVIVGLHPAAVAGVMSGAITNTPGWAAAIATLKELAVDPDLIGLTQAGYAVAYPFGVAGIIGSLIGIRLLFAIRPRDEVTAFVSAQRPAAGALNANFRLANPGLVGRTVAFVDQRAGKGVVISRVQRGDEQLVPRPDLVLAPGDLLHAVGDAEGLDAFQALVGERVDTDLRQAATPQRLATRELTVTSQHVVGETLAALDVPGRCGATITRIRRHGRELLADDGVDLHFGDRLLVVGDPEGLRRAAALVGDSESELHKPQLIGLFLGIAAGIVLGQIPIPIPGLSQPVKLGLAGGPIVAALIVSRLGHLGRHIIFHVGKGANDLMKEFGIALFLACVGLLTADKFVTYAFSATGVTWLLCALAIAMIPLLIVGVVARLWFRENYTALMGVMAGSCTDPPALAFANGTAGNEMPGLAYATVYPLTMLLRVVGAQLFVLMWLAR
jgi:putative transport protein